MSPKVCVVSALYHPTLGGLGRQAQLLTERLQKEGVEIFVISRKMEGMPAAEFSPSVEVIRVPCLYPRIHVFEEVSARHILLSISYSFGMAIQLVKHRRRYEIVHFHGASIPLFLCLPLLKGMGKKVIAKVAAANLGTEAGSLSGRYWIAGKFLAWLMRKVDAFVAISGEIREGLIRDGICEEKIHRISNFIEQDRFPPPPEGAMPVKKQSLGFRDKMVVLSSGRLVPRKGISHLLHAWRKVQDSREDVVLLVLGDGPLEAELKDIARQQGVCGSTMFLGRVDNVTDYLHATDLFVLPSLQEGMPNSLLEAMATSLPVIASRIGGVEDIVRDGVNGILVPPGDEKALADAILFLLASSERRERMGGEALRTITLSYGIETTVRRYLALYGRLASDGA